MPDADDAAPPEPLADLDGRPLPLLLLPQGSELARVFPASLEPLWFGPPPGDPPGGRFDDPERARALEMPTFGVCYLGTSREAAFAESFLRHPRLRVTSRETFDARGIARFILARQLRLVSLRGPGLAALQATAAIAHGPHPAARRWAGALWRHPERPDGIAYRCRHDDDQTAVALFDRASDGLLEFDRRGVRADRAWFGRTLDRYRLALGD